jgi:hypothetical protein
MFASMIVFVRLMAILLLVDMTLGSGWAAERRVALVVGNAGYASAPSLRNTINDASDVSDALARLGFEVITGHDLDKQSMDHTLIRFAQMIQGADVALFYYAGHGLQYRGQNYLVPIDANVHDEISLPFEATKLDDIINTLNKAGGVRLLILDACRSNPFAERLARASGTRDAGLSRGLARVEKAQGLLVAYSTQPNEVAADGNGRNSPFTEALLNAIELPGIEVTELFRRVRKNVYEATHGSQTPELSLSLLNEFYFNNQETDTDAWRRISASRDPSQLKQFIAQYPQSDWADNARMELENLTIQEQSAKLREELELARQAVRDLQARMAPLPPSTSATEPVQVVPPAAVLDSKHGLDSGAVKDEELARKTSPDTDSRNGPLAPTDHGHPALSSEVVDQNRPGTAEPERQHRTEFDLARKDPTPSEAVGTPGQTPAIAVDQIRQRAEAEVHQRERQLEELARQRAALEQAIALRLRMPIANAPIVRGPTGSVASGPPVPKRMLAPCGGARDRAQLGDDDNVDALRLCH